MEAAPRRRKATVEGLQFYNRGSISIYHNVSCLLLPFILPPARERLLLPALSCAVNDPRSFPFGLPRPPPSTLAILSPLLLSSSSLSCYSFHIIFPSRLILLVLSFYLSTQFHDRFSPSWPHRSSSSRLREELGTSDLPWLDTFRRRLAKCPTVFATTTASKSF